MEIKINTKFKIGESVYTCQKDTEFNKGKFISFYRPVKEPATIYNIHVIIKDSSSEILYGIGTRYPVSENLVFSSLEEAKNYCKNESMDKFK